MIVGIQISGLTSPAIRQAAFQYLQSRILMLPESISRALDIPGFIFYSDAFASDVPFFGVAVFNVTTIDISTPFYINISGGKLEVPTQISGGNIIFRTLNASDYILESDIDSSVKPLIEKFISEREMLYIEDVAPNGFVVDEIGNIIWDGLDELIY